MTTDIEDAESMAVIKWNHERNGLFNCHIPFNWGQKFPNQELLGSWNRLIGTKKANPKDYPPFIEMLSDVCLILGEFCRIFLTFILKIQMPLEIVKLNIAKIDKLLFNGKNNIYNHRLTFELDQTFLPHFSEVS